MKVKFSSFADKNEFAGLATANAAIASYMDMKEHDAVNHNNGDIELLKPDGSSFVIGDWYPVIYIAERRFFDIEV